MTSFRDGMKWISKAGATFFTSVIHLYRVAISPLLPRCCRFYPSCSSYALEAITRFGVWKGMMLAIWRILRCHPLTDGGFDPVPDTFRFRR